MSYYQQPGHDQLQDNHSVPQQGLIPPTDQELYQSQHQQTYPQLQLQQQQMQPGYDQLQYQRSLPQQEVIPPTHRGLYQSQQQQTYPQQQQQLQFGHDQSQYQQSVPQQQATPPTRQGSYPSQHQQTYPQQQRQLLPSAVPSSLSVQSQHSSQSGSQKQGHGYVAAPQNTATYFGNYKSVCYKIKHRNTGAILEITLPGDEVIKSEQGAMIHMEPSIVTEHKPRSNIGKLFRDDRIQETIYTGWGLFAIAPALSGDIMPLQIGKGEDWSVVMASYLAATSGVKTKVKSQGARRTLSAGPDLSVYQVLGEGMVWLTLYGARESISLASHQQHIVNTGHLVAWNCEYKIKLADGASWTGAKAEVSPWCMFTGPGHVYTQTRNFVELKDWANSLVPSEYEETDEIGIDSIERD